MGRSPRRHRSRSRSRSASRQQLKRGKSRSRSRSKGRWPVKPSARQHSPPPAADVGKVKGRHSSRDLGQHDIGPHTGEQRHRSRSIDRQPLRRSSGTKRSRSRSRSRERRHSSRRHRSRSRSRSRDKGQHSDRDGRGRRDGRHSPRRSSRSRSRRRSRSRSRDRAGGSSRQGRDAAAGYPGPLAECSPHPDHPDAKRSRWDAPQQQYGQQDGQQHQQRGWGEPGHGSRWDAGRPGVDVNTGRRGLPGPPLSDDPPPIGSIHRGVVQAVKPFGVFVAIEGFRRHVLVHHTQVSELVMLTRSDEDELKVKALEYAAPVGQHVWAKILEVSPDQSGSGGFRVHGSMRVVDQDSGQDLDPTGQMAAARGPGGGGGGRLSDEPPEVGSIHKGDVKRIEAYGVFVALPGFRKYGLVHASQVANYLEFSAEDGEAERKKALSDVVDLGQTVWVKVVEVGEDEKGRGPKIGCSIKLVDQGDGTDLDPQNMRYRPRGDGHGPHGGNKAPIGAHVGEVKGGAIDWGYLATRPDAFGSSGYDLLTDPPPEPLQQGGPGQPQQHHHHHQQHRQQQQQAMPPMGRGRSAVVPAWMTQQGGPGGGPAAPGSAAPPSPGRAGPNMTLEEALRVVQAAAAAGGKQHKKKHKKEKSKKHRKEKSSRKDSKRDRHRSRSRSSSSSSGGSDSGRR